MSVSDADMLASAYLYGHPDLLVGANALSIVWLNKPVSEFKAVEIGVSNSVTGPPSSVAVSPSGRYAVVIETKGSRLSANADALLNELPTGKRLTVIDLKDADYPALSHQLDDPERPLSVSFSPDGNLVAILLTSQPSQSPLVFYGFRNGKLVNRSLVQIPGYTAGDQLNGGVFPLNRNTLVLLDATKSMLCFYQFSPERVQDDPIGSSCTRCQRALQGAVYP